MWSVAREESKDVRITRVIHCMIRCKRPKLVGNNSRGGIHGDGANDVDMLKAAGLGVAYKGKPIAVKAARARIDFGDLRTLLFYQGYKVEEFVS